MFYSVITICCIKGPYEIETCYVQKMWQRFLEYAFPNKEFLNVHVIAGNFIKITASLTPHYFLLTNFTNSAADVILCLSPDRKC